MRSGLLSGALAGAAGTTMLNAVTYADMAIRGRSASGMPAQVVDAITDRAGVELGDEETASNRAESLGALVGIGVGVGVGAVFGLLRSRVRLPVPVAAVGLGLAATAATDGPAAALDLTDPRTWGTESWLSDLVPHLAYGLVTAIALEGLAGG